MDTPPKPLRRYQIGAAAFEAGKLAPGLNVVATPIGNLGDITVRALETLAAADVILCEDTRTTAKLLERYGIRNRLEAYHEHNAAKARPGILARLGRGLTFALVSDAGMPLVSDPGYRLVSEAIGAGFAVTCCPGPSAAVAGLALSGLPPDRFGFFGFLPQKRGERRRVLEELRLLRATLIFFESPHRIGEALADIAELYADRPVAVARELTKLHEEMLRGPALEIAANLAARPAVKGEITLLIAPPGEERAAVSEEEIEAAISGTLTTMPAGKAASEVARRFNIKRKDIYQRILAMRGTGR